MSTLFRELLSDKGNISMMRFLSLLCVMAAIVIAICGIYRGSSLNDVAMLCSAFLVPAFMGKAAQAFSEKSAS